MGGGGTTVVETSQNSSSTDLPAWAKPYFERNLARAETESLKPYEAYTGPRIAKSSDYGDLTKSKELTRDVASKGIAGLGVAQDYSKYAIDQSKELGNYTPTQASEYQFDPTRQFSGAEVQQYMDPYMQNVVDQQKQQAFSDFSRMNANRAQQGVNAGAFGGSRQGVVQGMAEEGLMGQFGQIQAKGLSDAYGQAVGAFQADRSAQSADQAAKAAEASRVQTFTEAGKQFAAGQGISALGAGANAAKDLAGYGQLDREADIQNVQLLDNIGRSEQGEDQMGLDIAYQDALAKQGYTAGQIGQLSNILQGLPIQASGSTTGSSSNSTYTPGPSGLQSAIGTGLQGLSLYKAYSGMGA